MVDATRSAAPTPTQPVTTPLDLWVHGLMGVEERIGTCTADAVLMELGATHYEREYGRCIAWVAGVVWMTWVDRASSGPHLSVSVRKSPDMILLMASRSMRIRLASTARAPHIVLNVS